MNMTARHSLCYSLLLVSISVTLSCGGGSISKVPPPLQTDVYVAGYEFNDSSSGFAKYWKNGTAVTLGAGTAGYATSIAVSGSDVYVAGIQGGSTTDVATYWKNGVPVSLTDGVNRGFAHSIFVDGNDVYVAGAEIISINGSFGLVAKYWKNGVPVALTDGKDPAEAMSILVSGTDVYVAGYENKTTQVSPNLFVTEAVAKYWKNGVATDLSDGLSFAMANSIVLSGNDVYVAGQKCQTVNSSCDVATYWKNGTPVPLTTQTPSYASSIVVSGSSVYVAGNTAGAPSFGDLWKDGGFTQLTPVTTPSYANQIAVVGSDVYIAGAKNSTAGYWKNGSFVPVTDGTHNAYGYAMAVVQH